MNISAVVLAKNNQKTIEKTLNALVEFDDVVVYDNGSIDDTIEIVKKFSNVNLIEGEFKGFGWTKNKAASFAKNDWILVVDSDEVIDKELLKELKEKILDNNCVYKLNFKAFYKDIQIKHCGWNNQKIKRLYNKSVTSYNSNDVHEDIITDNLKIEILRGNVEHYSYQTISEFVIKADRYSSLFAQNNVGKKSSSPAKAFFNGLYSFIKTYFFKQGFRDGYVGLIIAFSHMVTNFYKYIKLYELNNENKK
ncbi:glycosyltransferase family 2 protein [Aliarcobacter butzleri]|jgi:glycosyltransferase involved in cell wall biosynthesis|uniref:Glycosyltransferase family 2 protein n=1 Tax=Aliarcobacter butzleri TaxID=28197 RepID=A0AAW6VQ59_9BACT|nr:glycosyltransferase family 2 protein [Aliarcobacter butzleri]MCT7602198.1 glycosyltransferase family 2 protein [Aliarcobacter butzleri]MCT7606687.1 glycosyltransferase family 2 protein [Aliarcobacter butzleri]MCT7608969.1 glycosyltransferase family 2 protein [Aliarcobacter butzleri]MDK2062304.1 glycosyltransferase family 2 protein [Aliarcobacter butzleri]MDN5126543.1 glycosyltransferase family 2 protein [Aliarcobacter butzleri]